MHIIEIIQLSSLLLDPKNENFIYLSLIFLFIIIHSSLFSHTYHSLYLNCIPKKFKPFFDFEKWNIYIQTLFSWISPLTLLSIVLVPLYKNNIENSSLINYYSLLLMLTISLFSLKIILFNIKKPRPSLKQLILKRCCENNPLSLIADFFCMSTFAFCIEQTFNFIPKEIVTIVLQGILIPFVTLPLLNSCHPLHWWKRIKQKGRLDLKKTKEFLFFLKQLIQAILHNKI